MNSIVVFEDGSWEWESLSQSKVEGGALKHILIKIGDHWHDSEVSRMVKDFFSENVEYLFE